MRLRLFVIYTLVVCLFATAPASAQGRKNGRNGAPQITSTPPTTATVGVAYSYDVDATDPNGDTLTYALTQAPSGMTINAATGLIAWVPTSGQTGNQGVTVQATDPGGLSAKQSFTITVSSPGGGGGGGGGGGSTPSTTRVDLATPTTYTAAVGGSVAISLNWYRIPMALNYLQFMHLVNASGQQWSVDDHATTSATWTAGPYTETRTIALPSTLGAGTYDIRVGLAGGSPWTDIALVMGTGVTDPGNLHHYLVGTLTVGTGGTPPPPPPTTGIPIYPGDNIQAFVDANGPGATFLLKAGVHRLQSIRPQNNDTFLGEAGTVLSGSRLLTSFGRSGSYWVASGQTQQGINNFGECKAAYPLCTFPEELFFDNVALQPVASLAAVGPGKWYFDYGGDKIYFADDPTGHVVETSVTPSAFQPTADNVTISGLTIRGFANVAQQGAIDGDGRVGWIASNNDVGNNHGVGIVVDSGGQVLHNYVHANGQLGISGHGDGVLVQDNEISYNNRAGYWANWEAGGTKFVGTTNLVVRGNWAHHNNGPGLWTDADNIYTLYENNTSEDNERVGIFVEISYATIIRNNIVRRNGFEHADYIWGAGILIAGSPNVEIYGNTLDGNADGIGAAQQNRGTGKYGPHEISNLWVHDNTINNTVGWTGMVQDIGDLSYFTSRNNRFDSNHYLLKGTYPFAWMNGERTEFEWRQYGEDVNGTFSR